MQINTNKNFDSDSKMHVTILQNEHRVVRFGKQFKMYRNLKFMLEFSKNLVSLDAYN